MRMVHKQTPMITRDHTDRSMSYAQYRQLLQELLAQGKTTGSNQSEMYVNYGKMNVQRMARLHKTATLVPGLAAALAKIERPYIWLVLTEGWCGDAAQNLPTMSLVAEACPFIELRLLLRDENPHLMDQYLTNSGRSIPKLICVEKESLKEVFTWGPRPEAAQELMLGLQAASATHEEKALAIQKWYNADKTLSLQDEMLQLVELHLLH